MKATEIRSMTPDERTDQLASLKKEQFNLRFQKASGQLNNTSRVRQVRKDIARLMTQATTDRAAAKKD
ncbi:MAG: 50S ribosomal protein L29 [Bauldia sp.]|nr:50S ribosomal protein L29 [Bauldia sp.]MCW5719161.1 50S ribosomal protein L29 [Bauldia sp.]